MGAIGSENLPEKTNLKKLSGLNALTGKANFDISEWMILKLAEAVREHSFDIAILCKTGVARKALEYFWKHEYPVVASALYRIDALKWFETSVDACLFYPSFERGKMCNKKSEMYDSLDSLEHVSSFGIVDGKMASNVLDYEKLKRFSGINYYRWWSRIKHD